MKNKILLLFSTLLCIHLNAQTPLERALWKYEDKNYMDAALDIEKAIGRVQNETTKADAMAKLGHCYYFLNDFSQAQKWYDEALKSNYQNAEMQVYYGDILTYQGKYDQAANYYKMAQNDSVWGNFARLKLKNAQNASKVEELPGVLLHRNLKNINSEMGDYGFSLINEKMAVFTSAGSLFSKEKDKKTGQGFSKLILAEKDQNKEWKISKVLPENINSIYNNGSFTYDPVHKIGYFSQCNGPDGKGKNCVILSTSFDPNIGKWGSPQVLPFCLDGFNYAHPAISADGRTLFFTSDRPGGIGGKDIFKASKGSGTNAWGSPTNLGDKINTIGHEGFPSLAGDSMFYFSSNALQGIGGYDIYKADYNNGTPKNPAPMPKPFNSPADDFGFIQSSHSKYEGYYCSNRAGGIGGDDIYFFELDPKFKTIAGSINDEKTKEPIPFAKIYIQGTDGSIVEAISDKNGRFYLENMNPEVGYKVLGSAEGFFSGSSSIPALNLQATTDQSDILKQRNNMSIPLLKITKEEIKLDNIYYAYNKADLTPESKRELQKLITLLKETPSVSIVINSHSDEQGGETYNMDLSQRRAKSVVNYLVENGIEAHRLSAKGWGETNPIHKNATTEEQHAQNRRTTFQVTNAQ